MAHERLSGPFPFPCHLYREARYIFSSKPATPLLLPHFFSSLLGSWSAGGGVDSAPPSSRIGCNIQLSPFLLCVFLFLIAFPGVDGFTATIRPPPSLHFCSPCVEKPNRERNVRASPTEVYTCLCTCLCTCVCVCVWESERKGGVRACVLPYAIFVFFFTMEFLSRLTTNSFFVFMCASLLYTCLPSLSSLIFVVVPFSSQSRMTSRHLVCTRLSLLCPLRLCVSFRCPHRVLECVPA